MTKNKIGSFDDYLNDIKALIKDNRKEYNEIGRAIKTIDFHCSEVEPNFEYFRECYDDNQTPEQAIINLKYNDSDLYRKIDNITDEIILSEVDSRCLKSYVISDCNTYELEDEIKDRYDATLINKNDLDDEELIEILSYRRKADYYFNDKKSIISEVLGFSNNFAYTIEDAIKELEKIW